MAGVLPETGARERTQLHGSQHRGNQDFVGLLEITMMARLEQDLRTTRIYGEEGPSVRDEQEGWGLLRRVNCCIEASQHQRYARL
jgi:hypothetical protein